jgi:hypothetical protein
MDYLDLRTTGTKAFNGLIERSYTQGRNRWAQRKNKHLVEAGSEIRVVARIKTAVNVVTTFEERRRPTPKSCGRHYRIHQLDSRASVEGAALACFGVDGDYHQSFFRPSLNRKLCGNGFPPVPAARTRDPQRQRSHPPENRG